MRFLLAELTGRWRCSETFQIKWQNLKDSHTEKYKNTVEELCSNLCDELSGYDDRDMIDKRYDNVVHVIKTASDKCLSRSKGYKQFLKPYWNDCLK